MKEIHTNDLFEKYQAKEELNILDVRRDDEVAEGKIKNAQHIILDELSERLNELDKDKTYHIVCRSGGRSGKAGEFLAEKGYDVINIDGGMLAWEGETE